MTQAKCNHSRESTQMKDGSPPFQVPDFSGQEELADRVVFLAKEAYKLTGTTLTSRENDRKFFNSPMMSG